MIYQVRAAADPIQQGDLFRSLPVLSFSPRAMAIPDENGGTVERNWTEIEQPAADLLVVASVRSVPGIVITQDCDALRCASIALAELRPFDELVPPPAGTAGSAKWLQRSINRIIQQAKINLKWFYLPSHGSDHFTAPMAADFTAVFSLPRVELEAMRERHRIGALNPEALEHFRERIGAFFRRYAHDEWYALSPEEFRQYRADRHGDASIAARPGQD